MATLIRRNRPDPGSPFPTTNPRLQGIYEGPPVTYRNVTFSPDPSARQGYTSHVHEQTGGRISRAQDRIPRDLRPTFSAPAPGFEVPGDTRWTSSSRSGGYQNAQERLFRRESLNNPYPTKVFTHERATSGNRSRSSIIKSARSGRGIHVNASGAFRASPSWKPLSSGSSLIGGSSGKNRQTASYNPKTGYGIQDTRGFLAYDGPFSKVKADLYGRMHKRSRAEMSSGYQGYWGEDRDRYVSGSISGRTLFNRALRNLPGADRNIDADEIVHYKVGRHAVRMSFGKTGGGNYSFSSEYSRGGIGF